MFTVDLPFLSPPGSSISWADTLFSHVLNFKKYI